MPRKVVGQSLKPGWGDTVAFELYGSGYIGEFRGSSLVMEEGEAIRGEVLGDVQLVGVVTWILFDAREWLRPAI